MNNLKVIVLASVAILPGLAACSDSDPAPELLPETAVCLEGAIGASTRGIIGSGYEQDLKVSFARQDESAVSMGAYGGWAVHEAVRQGGRGNRPIVFAQSQSYPADGRHIRLHGYYPAKGGADNRCRRGQSNLPHRRNDGYHGHGNPRGKRLCSGDDLYVPSFADSGPLGLLQ